MSKSIERRVAAAKMIEEKGFAVIDKDGVVKSIDGRFWITKSKLIAEVWKKGYDQNSQVVKVNFYIRRMDMAEKQNDHP